jgi:hypothetical protein
MAPSVLGDGLWLSGGTKCFFLYVVQRMRREVQLST